MDALINFMASLLKELATKKTIAIIVIALVFGWIGGYIGIAMQHFQLDVVAKVTDGFESEMRSPEKYKLLRGQHVSETKGSIKGDICFISHLHGNLGGWGEGIAFRPDNQDDSEEMSKWRVYYKNKAGFDVGITCVDLTSKPRINLFSK